MGDFIHVGPFGPSMSLSVLDFKPDTNTQFSSLFTDVARLMMLDICSGVLLLIKSFVPWYKMILFSGEVSFKHALTGGSCLSW